MGDLAEKHPVCISVIEAFTNIYEFTFVFYCSSFAKCYSVEVMIVGMHSTAESRSSKAILCKPDLEASKTPSCRKRSSLTPSRSFSPAIVRSRFSSCYSENRIFRGSGQLTVCSSQSTKAKPGLRAAPRAHAMTIFSVWVVRRRETCCPFGRGCRSRGGRKRYAGGAPRKTWRT
jgi:hypothetical protein